MADLGLHLRPCYVLYYGYDEYFGTVALYGELMNQNQTTQSRAIFTIGHSNHRLEQCIALLHRQQIAVLVDVHSFPISSYEPQFNRQTLQTTLKTAGMKYLFLGEALGGRPADEQSYADGHVLYALVAQSPLFLEGIQRLEKGLQDYRIAILCSEENPTHCHRRLLVGRVLVERGVTVCHIRADGSMQIEKELVQALTPPPSQQQLALFEELQETDTWKSTLSVSPKKRRRSSSGS